MLQSPRAQGDGMDFDNESKDAQEELRRRGTMLVQPFEPKMPAGFDSAAEEGRA